MKQKIRSIWLHSRYGLLGAALLIALSSVLCVRLVRGSELAKGTSPAQVSVSVNETPIPRDAVSPTTSFAPIVKRVAQSIVQVDVSTKPHAVQMQGQQMPYGDDLLRRFFGDQFNQGQGGPNQTFMTPRQYGLGSGVIVTKDGYIVSNNHVVDGADNIKVTLNDGRKFTARVIGRDPKSDIAVLKIDATDLPFMTLADSDKVEVGDVCLAIGNPFGIGQTVTMGIVSATGRNNVAVGEQPGNYEDFIQTDAAINPGNSGGALVDAEGRLIGINTAILSRDGGNQGIGFAVPVNLAHDVMDSLVAKGKVDRGYLGVGPQEVTPDLADAFHLKADEHGALIGDIAPGGPAEKAGLKSGDIILEFNDKPVNSADRFRFQVAAVAPGTTVPVKIMRDGKSETINVTVSEWPGEEKVAKADNKTSESSDTLNGVQVADLNPNTARQMNLPESLKGAVITDVDQNSPAYDAGLRPGQVIEEINHKPVRTADDAVKLTESVKDRKTLLKLWSRDQSGNAGTRYLVVDETNAG
jgi:serine protease Do